MQQDKIPPKEELIQLLKELKDLESQEALIEYDRLLLALDRGKILLKIKKELPHGAFLPFLKSNQVKLSPRSAERYMQLAKHEKILSSNSPVLANLTVEKALKLINSCVRKEKQDIPVQLVSLSKFAVISSFDAQSQEYLVTLKIAASVIGLLSHKTNMKIVNAANKEALLSLIRSRSLIDLSAFSGN